MTNNLAPNFWKSIRKTIVNQKQAATIKPVAQNQKHIPLSYNQEQLWQLDSLNIDSVYNITNVLRFSLELNVQALEKSLREIVRRQAILRTIFPLVDGQPVQNIVAETNFKLPILDLRNLSSTEKETKAQRIAIAQREKTFDLTKESGFRVQLIHLDTTEFILILTMHHLIFDGASFGIFFKELKLLYEAFSHNQPNPLPEVSLQYADFACWQRKLLANSDDNYLFKYWQKKLQGTIEPLKLPQDSFQNAAFQYQGGFKNFQLSLQLTEKIKTFSAEQGVTLFSILLTVFKTLLYCYTKQTDIILVTPTEGRDRPETKNIVGYFNNLLLLRDCLDNNPTFLQLLNSVNSTFLSAREHQDFPFEKFTEFPNLARVSLSRCMFAFSNYQTERPQLSEQAPSSIKIKNISHEKSNFDFSLSMSNRESKIRGTIKYKTSLFTEDTITKIVANFRNLLEQVITNPELNLESLPYFGAKFLDKRDLQVTIRGFNIDLREIETVLEQHPNLESSLVLVREDINKDKFLVAYLVPTQRKVPEFAELRSFLQQKLPSYMIPAALVPLETMPLTSNGKIDLAALAEINLARQSSGQNYVAPRNATEKKLAAIWTKVLWLDEEVGIHDNFFDLGGHSLLSVRLIAEIEQAFNRKVPLAALFPLATIAELATILNQETTEVPITSPNSSVLAEKQLAPEIYHQLLAYTAGWQGTRVKQNSLILGMNTSGKKQAIFWCLQGFRELSQLAKYLGAEQPVYGMRSGHLLMKYTPENIQALAAHYVTEILNIDPNGPYILGGNCQSVFIIFEIAQELQRRGKTITLLSLVENFVPQSYSGRVAFFFCRDSHKNPYKYFAKPKLGWRKFYSGEISLDILACPYPEYFDEPTVQIFAKKLDAYINDVTAKPQLLSQEAYQAEITVQESLAVPAGESVAITVNVKNISPVLWQATSISGIALGNHWFDHQGKLIQQLDGRAELAQNLATESEVMLSLTVTAPIEPGCYYLELDMVEEGVTWFKQKGSKAEIIRVTVAASPVSKKLQSENVAIYSKLGNSLLEKGDTKRAILNYQKALALNPQECADGELYQNLGVAFTRQQNWVEAIAAYTEAIRLQPQNAYLQYLMGQAQGAQDNFSATIVHYQKAIELGLEQFELYQDLGDALYQQKQLEQAKLAYQKATKLRPNESYNYDKLADIHDEQGDLAAMVNCLKKSLEISPDNAGAHATLGNTLFRLNRFSEAIIALQNAIVIDSQNSVVYLVLGHVQAELGNHQEAIAAYDKALKLQPDDQVVKQSLASLRHHVT
ncbi:MAG: condensation domain-containing protein [Cyanobacteria bacterium P01_F01_bin.143]